MKRVFLYRIKNSDDRDCCAYIEGGPMRFECEHYFGGVVLHGSCYCGHRYAAYKDIETVLTEDEYTQLIEFANCIDNLGYGIKRGDERYQKGISLCKGIQPVYDKLLSEEAREFFEKITEEEHLYLMNRFHLDEDDIEKIFNNYTLEYRDRSVVSHIFENEENLGYEEAFSLGYIKPDDKVISKYFDFEKFGEDLAENDDEYVQLDDGRIARLNY